MCSYWRSRFGLDPAGMGHLQGVSSIVPERASFARRPPKPIPCERVSPRHDEDPTSSPPRGVVRDVEVSLTGSESSRLAPDSPSGFAAWVDPELGRMARLAARLAPGADRDDIVQEALVRAW